MLPNGNLLTPPWALKLALMVIVIYLHRLVASKNDFQITKDARQRGNSERFSSQSISTSLTWRLHLSLSPLQRPILSIHELHHSFIPAREAARRWQRLAYITSKIEKLPSIITVGLVLQGRASTRAWIAFCSLPAHFLAPRGAAMAWCYAPPVRILCYGSVSLRDTGARVHSRPTKRACTKGRERFSTLVFAIYFQFLGRCIFATWHFCHLPLGSYNNISAFIQVTEIYQRKLLETYLL